LNLIVETPLTQNKGSKKNLRGKVFFFDGRKYYFLKKNARTLVLKGCPPSIDEGFVKALYPYLFDAVTSLCSKFIFNSEATFFL